MATAAPGPESPAATTNLIDGNRLIRRTAVVRTRMPGGVGGVAPRGAPLSRLRAPAQSPIIVLGMRVLQAVAGRGRPGRVLRAPSLPAANRLCASQVQATSPISSCDPVGRITSHPVGGRHPHQNSSCTRTRGSEGRGHSVRRRFSAIGGHDRRPPGPADQVRMVRGWECRLTLSSSGRPRPERRPAWQTAIAQPGACARPRRSRSDGCGRVRQTQ